MVSKKYWFSNSKFEKFDSAIDNDILKLVKLKSNKKTSNDIHVWAYGGSTSDVGCEKKTKIAGQKI